MKIGIIFPGYGSQFVGMGKDIYDDYRSVQEYFEEAYNCLNINFIKLCFASSEQELSAISNAYLSIFLLSISLYSLLKELGIKPDVVAGYGIGQFSAITAAGGLSFPDALYLLKKFSSFYEESLLNLDAAVIKVDGITSGKLKKICNDLTDVNIAISNTDYQHIVSGKRLMIEELKSKLNENSEIGKIQDINIAVGLHSNLMSEIAQQLKLYLEKVDFKDLQIPFVGNIKAKELITGQDIKEYVIDQINEPISWNKVLDKFADCDYIIDVGPGSANLEFLKQKYPEKKILAFNKKSDIEEIKEILNQTNQINSEILVEEGKNVI